MKRTIIFGLLIVLAMWITSCDDDKEILKSKVTVLYQNPSKYSDFKTTEMILNVYNRTSGQTKTMNIPMEEEFIVEEGVYTFSIEGKCEYTVKEDGKTEKVSSSVKGIRDNEIVTGKSVSVNIPLFVTEVKAGFVIEEIFFTGTLTPEGKQYDSDKFIEIYNNSDKVLYADGLSIAETDFISANKQDYKPDIMSKAVTAQAVYTIPGDGDDWPVQPGESLLIVDVAKNHKESNPNSFDYTNADFEWYDNIEGRDDVDVPNVPNLIKTYSSSAAPWSFHNRGFTSFILFRMEKTAEKFLAENKYDYTWDFAFNGKVYPMSGECYQVPNTWVVDAVGLSTPSDFEWMVLDPSLDFSYTHSGDAGEDRYGKSVRRKVAYTTASGRKVLMDSNNSGIDFEPTAEPTPGFVK